MAQTGDPPFPLDGETKLVIKLLREAAAKCMRVLKEPPGGTESARTFAASRAAEQLKGINRQLDAVKGKLANVAAAKVAGAYQQGLLDGDKLATAAGIAPPESPFKGSFNLVDRRRAEVLARQTVGDLTKAVESIRDTTGRLVREMQAVGVDRTAVKTILAGGTIQGVPRQTLQRLKKEIQKAAIDGKIVTVNAKTGVTMSFDPGDYAEMVFQTKLAETTNIATVERLRARRGTHVKIIGSNSRNFCTAFVGRVFYIGDGVDPLGYPHIRELPNGGAPFHPRCTKRYVAFVPALATPKQLEDGRLKPNERELLGPNANAAHRRWEREHPAPQAKAAPKSPTSKAAARKSPSAKPTPAKQPTSKPTAAAATGDDDLVLVARMDDSGRILARFDIKNQAVAESASRAWERCRKAGFQVPEHFVDGHDIDIFEPGTGDDNLAGYSAADNKVYVNPNTPKWNGIAERIKAARVANHASSDDPDHVMIHEIGHYAHRNAVGLDRYKQIRKQRFTKEEAALVAREVSLYGATQPLEMIAEVFAAKIAGQSFPKAILDLYKRYGGV